MNRGTKAGLSKVNARRGNLRSWRGSPVLTAPRARRGRGGRWGAPGGVASSGGGAVGVAEDEARLRRARHGLGPWRRGCRRCRRRERRANRWRRRCHGSTASGRGHGAVVGGFGVVVLCDVRGELVGEVTQWRWAEGEGAEGGDLRPLDRGCSKQPRARAEWPWRGSGAEEGRGGEVAATARRSWPRSSAYVARSATSRCSEPRHDAGAMGHEHGGRGWLTAPIGSREGRMEAAVLTLLNATTGSPATAPEMLVDTS
jgi:hypothetical protein